MWAISLFKVWSYYANPNLNSSCGQRNPFCIEKSDVYALPANFNFTSQISTGIRHLLTLTGSSSTVLNKNKSLRPKIPLYKNGHEMWLIKIVQQIKQDTGLPTSNLK